MHPGMSPRLGKTLDALSRLGSGRGAVRADITLIDDVTIAELAGKFRGSPHPTDVLAFVYDDDPSLSGEVVISLDTAKRQAEERGVSMADELTLLCVHGLLHVRGVGDEGEAEWRRMRTAEFETLMRIL